MRNRSPSARKHAGARPGRIALPPPGLRPKLTVEQRWAASIDFTTTIATLACEDAQASHLWSFIRTVAIWKKVSEHRRYPDAAATFANLNQNVTLELLTRWVITGIARLTPAEHQNAVDSIAWAEALAEDTDQLTLKAAIAWADTIVGRLQDQYLVHRAELAAKQAAAAAVAAA